MNYCNKCGTPLNPNTRFCGNCGEMISHETAYVGPGSSYDSAITEASPQYHGSDRDFKMPNTQQRIVTLWLLLGAVFLACVFLPSFIGLDGMDGGYAMSFVSGFMVIVSLIIILVYRARAKQLDKILSGEGRIALWSYLPEEWMRFVATDFEDEKKIKRNLFILVTSISIVVGIILMIVIQDPLILLIISGIIAIVAIPAFWAPRYRFRKLQHSEARALIAEKGVIVGKMFHLWVQMGARLDGVVIDMESDPKLIEFTYSIPTRYGRQEEIARVPVPRGKMDEAMRIVGHFNNREV